MMTVQTNDGDVTVTPPCLTPFTGPIAWSMETLTSEDGVLRVGDAVLAEVKHLVATLRDNPLPLELLSPAEFPLPACRALIHAAKVLLDDGPGFVVIDRLPVEHYSREEHRALYWVLMQMLARPVAQDWHGRMIYDVWDTGKPEGNGVRGVLTNVGQNFHTDNNFNLCPPEYVALYCLQPAMQGGINAIVSFLSVHNEMLRRHPDLLSRLYQPYLFDRQREHAPHEPQVIRRPLFEYDGKHLRCRLSYRQVVNGYTLAGEKLDDQGREALETLEAIMNEPQWIKEFFFEPGQIQIVDNTRCGHRRTAFQDFPEPERRRHLIRLWLRDAGRRFYNG